MDMVMAILAGGAVLIAGLAYFFPRSPKPSTPIAPAVVTEKQREEQMAIYQSTRRFLSSLTVGRNMDGEEHEKFRVAKLDAALLFDDDIADYLSGIYTDATTLQYHEMSAEGDSGKVKHLQRAMDIKLKLINELLERRLEEKFKPFLQVN